MDALPMSDYEPVHTQALRWKNVLELPDPRLARILGLAQKMLQVPIALIQVTGGDEGLRRVQCAPGLGAGEASQAEAFCTAAPHALTPLIVADLAEDRRFQDDPRVNCASAVRFYASLPLRAPDATILGTFSLMDHCPREFSEIQKEVLEDLAELAASELRHRALETIDEVTNLSNRRGFLFIGGQVLALRNRSGEPSTLVSLQLDGLRSVDGGDRPRERAHVMREFGRLLLESFRDSDVVARLQANEFCVLLSPERHDDVAIPIGRLEAAIDTWNRAKSGTQKIAFRYDLMDFDAEQDQNLPGLLAAAEAEAGAKSDQQAEVPPAIGGSVSLLRLLEKRQRRVDRP